MYVKRNLEQTLLRHLASPEIVAVVGPRQAGKTTLIKNILNGLKKSVSVSFDDQNILTLFEKAPDDFITAYVKGNDFLFIDEFQYARSGGRILKYIFDTQKIKIIISGSSAIDLTVKALKYLVGRVLIFNLYPFDFQEFLTAKDAAYLKIYHRYKTMANLRRPARLSIPESIHKKLLHYYEEYLLFGGYPRVVLEENPLSKKELLRNIYNTYFLREIRDILGLIDDYKLQSLIKALALQIGGLIEYGELSRLTGYSYSSLKKYLNFLEKTYICRLIKPFYKNKRTEIVKNPKVYFFDTGLRNSIVDDSRPLDERTDTGALLENGLAMQFIKNDFEFHFWRDKKKNELDFVVSLEGGRKIAIESKSYLKTTESAAMAIFQRAYPTAEKYFSYKDRKSEIKNKGVYPIYFY